MVARINSAEGGTDGAVVTTANSGGASGDPWDSLSIPSGTSITFAIAAAYKGTLGYRATQGAGSGTGANVRWNLSGWPQVRFRFYFKTSAYPTVAVQTAYITDATNTKVLAKFIYTTAGKLGVQNAAGSTLFTATAATGLATTVRVEGIVVPGTTTTNGTIRFAWGVGDAAATDTYASTSANTGTDGTLGRLYVGKLAGTWNADTDFDDFAADDASSTSFLGASTTGPTVVDPTPPPPAPDPAAWPPPDPYREAIRNGVGITYSVSATYGGAPVEGASDLRPVGGSITDTTRPGVRRVLNLSLAPDPGLFEKLAPVGTQLNVFCKVTYTDRSSVTLPMGVFDVDSDRLSEGGGGIALTAPDKWVRIQRARFLVPTSSTPGMRVTEQIAALIRGALGADEPVSIEATSLATMGRLTWEKDRDKAIMDLAASIGAWVYFDRNGAAIVADIPAVGADANWLVDASASGVLTELERERSRTDTYNVIVVESSAADGAKFPTQIVWDTDPSSPTYAGTHPRIAPHTAGPFGIVTDYLDSPVIATVAEARKAGAARLARVSGLASQVSLGQVPNPAVDAFDVIDVLPPRERADIPRVLERHVVDTVTHPLIVGSAQQIEGRSTRAEEVA